MKVLAKLHLNETRSPADRGLLSLFENLLVKRKQHRMGKLEINVIAHLHPVSQRTSLAKSYFV